MSDALSFRVYGVARPQGSLTLVNAGGPGRRPYLKNSDTLIVWRNSVVDKAVQAAQEHGWACVDDEPVLLQAYFTFDRPKSHTKRQEAKDAGRKERGSDLDKLVRAIGDALTAANVISDDKLITDIDAWKRYVGAPGALDRPGAEIRVVRLGHVPPNVR